MNAKLKTLLFGGRGAGSATADLALAVVRIASGLLIALGHGKGKLFHDGTVGIPEQLVQGTAKLGFPAPTFFAWCSVLAEFVGGLLLAAGLFTRPVALILAFNMAVAAFGACMRRSSRHRGAGSHRRSSHCSTCCRSSCSSSPAPVTSRAMR